MMSPFTRVVVGLVLSGLVLTGCTDESVQTRATPEPSTLRTDIEPLMGRLPALGNDFTAQWLSNTTYDQSGPEPASYWIHALITPTDGVAGLIDGTALTPGTPDVREQLSELLPECDWEFAEEVSRAWGPLDWETHVWFCQEQDQLVITLTGDA